MCGRSVGGGGGGVIQDKAHRALPRSSFAVNHPKRVQSSQRSFGVLIKRAEA